MPATAESKPSHDDDGWRHLGGGAAVHIGEGGIIDAGCPGLEGEHVEHLDDNREERAQRQKQAEQAGWKSQDHQDAEAAHAQVKPSTPEGSIALVRVGGKYHTFGDDAQHMQRVLGMGDGKHAEFDHEHLEDHLKRLVKNGHRVAIVERKQDQQPEHKAQVGPEHAEAIDADQNHEDSEPGRLPDMEKEEEGDQEGKQVPETAEAPPVPTSPTANPAVRVSKDGTQWIRAAKGGQTSNVNGQQYKGGQWMPVHGLSVQQPKQELKPKQPVQGATPPKPNEDGKGKGPRPAPREMTPEEIEQRRHHDRWVREISPGPLGRLLALGERPHSINRTSAGTKQMSEYANSVGEENLQKLNKWLEPLAISHDIENLPDWQRAQKTDAEWAQEWRENANANAKYRDNLGWTKKQLKATPSAPDTIWLVSEALSGHRGNYDPQFLYDVHKAMLATQQGKPLEPIPGIHDAPYLAAAAPNIEDSEQPAQQPTAPSPFLATAQQHLQTAPPKMRHAIEAMHKLADVQRDGTGLTKRLSPGYAQSLHDHLSNMPGHSDGFGQVYDLSDHLGPGAMGYYSPAGVLALVPPQWQGEPWEARYSAETQPTEAQQPNTPVPERDLFDEIPESGDSYEPSDNAATTEATRQHLAELTKDHKGLAAAVAEAFPHSVELQAAAADMAIQEWQQHHDFNEEFKRQRRYLLNAAGGKDWGIKAAQLKRAADRGADAQSAIKGFDTLAQAYKHEAPLMFTPLKWDNRRGRYVEAGGAGDRGQTLDSDETAALLDNLARPEREFETPAPEDHRFLGAVLDELERWKDAAQPEQEAVPFSRRGFENQLAGVK